MRNRYEKQKGQNYWPFVYLMIFRTNGRFRETENGRFALITFFICLLLSLFLFV